MDYLILEPTVFVEIKNTIVLIYNSLDGAKLQYSNSDIVDLFKTMKNDINIVPLEKDSLTIDKVKKIIKDIEENNFGFLATRKIVAPIQFSPVINIQNEYGLNNEITDSSYNSILNLREISLYLNGNIQREKIPYLNKQLICNFPDSNETVMDIELLTVFLSPVIQSGSLFRINLLGGNIFNYPFLKELINIFKPLDVEKQICFYLNLTDIKKEYEKLNLLLQFSNSKFFFNLDNNSYLESIDVIKQYLPNNKVEYNCIVESIDDVKQFQKLEDKNFNMNYLPVFNGSNLEFFKENVFIGKSDISSLLPNQNEVFNNIKLNSRNYGKITILNNGDVYANINQEILGNISKTSVTEIISKEFCFGNSWFLTRNKVNPCKNCVYNILCPPISNYEHVLNRFNLCNIQ